MHTSRLTSTLRRLIRRDPAARLVDTTAGSSCGVMPTAIASENSKASRIGLCQHDVDHEDRDGQRAGDVHQQQRELPQPDLELGVQLMGVQTGGDLAELGRGPGGHHDTGPAATLHDRAHQGASGQFGQRRRRRDRRSWSSRSATTRPSALTRHRPDRSPSTSRRSAGTMSPSRSPTTISRDQRGDVELLRTVHSWSTTVSVVDLGVQCLGRLLRPELIDESEPDRRERR